MKMLDTDEFREFLDLLEYVSEKGKITAKKIKDVKELEIELKETTINLKEQTKNFEKRIASVVAKEVLQNLDDFFINSKKIRESAEAIHQASLKIQKAKLKDEKKRYIVISILSFLLGITVSYFLNLKL